MSIASLTLAKAGAVPTGVTSLRMLADWRQGPFRVARELVRFYQRVRIFPGDTRLLDGINRKR
jgi:hypothetical protein